MIMTPPARLRALLAATGLTQAGAASQLGIGARSMRRYLAEGGPEWLELALMALAMRAIVLDYEAIDY